MNKRTPREHKINGLQMLQESLARSNIQGDIATVLNTNGIFFPRKSKYTLSRYITLPLRTVYCNSA